MLAENGQDALAVLAATPVAMVISDVRMRGLDGIELVGLKARLHTRVATSLRPETLIQGFSPPRRISPVPGCGRTYRNETCRRGSHSDPAGTRRIAWRAALPRRERAGEPAARSPG